MTNKTYGELLAGGGGGAAAGGWDTAFLESRSITFTEPGTVVLSVAGAGGGGAAAASSSGAATGGNSAPWGRKKIKASAGDELEVTIGAGGARAAANSSPGSPGGTTTVKLNGVTIITVQGGEGGVFAAGAVAAIASTPAATVTGADYWRAGIKAGTTAVPSGGASVAGGAAVDALSVGKGRSPGLANVDGGSVGTDAGGRPQSWIVLAAWGVVITDPANSGVTVGSGVAGCGGTSTTAAGMFGGGVGGNAVRGAGGRGGGGGGGGSAGAAGPGGDAYAYLTFTPTE